MATARIASDGKTTVKRGALITIDAGSVQSMVANTPEGFERHLIVEVTDEPLTPDAARELAGILNGWAAGSLLL